ncbi:MAG: 16S rRNA (guanine(527)-N(7))-methyltransferase RsmG [Lachnospiraceae bacterium]|nr:16S rRNA (guanine(527)-N(7))-methyltransferase RsmG [Lachnospiraceae bacterium]
MRREYLEKAFAGLGIRLDSGQILAFERYTELLLSWNEKINLTAITDPQDIVIKHFADSCGPLGKEILGTEGRLADIGTGAGFPGIPLKILCPDLEIVLMDSLKKRIGFLETVIDELSLKGIRAVHGRAEDLARTKEFREQFDLVTARAVAQLPVLAEYCLPFVKVGGSFLAYKSAGAQRETEQAAAAIRLLGGGKPEIREYLLPDSDYRRSLIRIEKRRETPKTFPRKAGTASKKPLYRDRGKNDAEKDVKIKNPGEK